MFVGNTQKGFTDETSSKSPKKKIKRLNPNKVICKKGFQIFKLGSFVDEVS